jgi:hypothetical protein
VAGRRVLITGIGASSFDRHVGTVVHEQIARRPGPGMSARAMHELNVIGSLDNLVQRGGTLVARNARL